MMPPLAERTMLPSDRPTTPSLPRIPYLITSIGVPAWTTPLISGVTRSVAGFGGICSRLAWADAASANSRAYTVKAAAFNFIHLPLCTIADPSTAEISLPGSIRFGESAFSTGTFVHDLEVGDIGSYA